jgi:arabinofuranosyltransferase
MMQEFTWSAAVNRLRPFFIPLCVALSVALLSAQVVLFKDFGADDTFISFRFVRQWTHGNGLVFNIGEYVEGYSNFLWLVLLAAADLLGYDLLIASKVLGVICTALSLAITWRFSTRLLPGSYLAALPPLLLITSVPFAAWTMGGLETPLFALLLVAAAYRFTPELADSAAWPLSAVALALLGMTRPEGAIAFPVAAAYRAWSLYRDRRRPTRRDFIWAAVFVAIYGGYFAWRVSYYHALLPNTVYAKSMGLHPRAFIEGVYYVGDFFLKHLGWGLAVLLGPLALLHSRRDDVGFMVAVVAAYLALFIYAGGDIQELHRFFAHIYPLLVLIVGCGLYELSAIMGGRLSPRTRERLTAAVVLALLLSEIFLTLQVRLLAQHYDTAPRDELIRYMRAKLKPGDTVAVIDAGFLPYSMPLDVRVLDMVGLTDAHIAHLPVRLPGGLLARNNAFGKWDVDYVLQADPLFVQVNLLTSPEAPHRETNWIGTTELVNDPRFREKYKYVELPGLAGIFERITTE